MGAPKNRHHIVAHVFIHVTTVTRDDGINRLEIAVEQIMGRFRAQLLRQASEAGEVGEHDRHLPLLAHGCRTGQNPRLFGAALLFFPKAFDGLEQFSPVANRFNADLPQVVGCQLGQGGRVDVVVGKGLSVLVEPQDRQATILRPLRGSRGRTQRPG